jgi:hypothetical protein
MAHSIKVIKKFEVATENTVLNQQDLRVAIQIMIVARQLLLI